MNPDGSVDICAAELLLDGGKGIRFPVLAFGTPATGFVVRHGGRVVGYLNRCAHVPVALDWFEGEFFDSGKLYLMCSTHGALYAPESGACVGGPCRGGHLRPIAVREADGRISWQPDQQVREPAPKADEAG